MRLLASLLILLSTSAYAQDLSPKKSWKNQARAIIEREKDRQQVVGVAVGLIHDGKIAYLEGFGWEDREKRIPVTRRTLFRWASISKPITAVTALQLWDKGLLDLDRDIRDYVPEFPKKDHAITARQLLCHQGGIVHYRNGPVIRSKTRYKRPNPFSDVVKALDTFKESPLVNVPGEKFSYSTHGYILLSAVTQRAGKQSFAKQAKERIFDPLGMSTTRPDYQWEEIPHRAIGYRKRLGRISPSSNTDVSWKLGGGGFLSNIDDLAKFAQGLMNHSILSKKAKAIAWKKQRGPKVKRTNYGLGFAVQNSGKELKVSHSGAQEKTRTFMTFYPRKGMGIVVMTNSEYANPGAFARALWHVLQNKRPTNARLY